MNTESSGIRPWAFAVLHTFLTLSLLAMALHLHVLTLARIRAFHPQYPWRMVLAPYTPIPIAKRFYVEGPIVLSVVSAVALGVSVSAAMRKVRIGPVRVAIIGAQLACLVAATYVYALSAVQLAGVAAHLVAGARH